jgi:hypothetical protein
MSLQDRAAEFSPFAALTGYEGIIAESGRLTDTATELAGAAVEELNAALGRVAENIHLRPEVTVTYFEPDKRKSGGSYRTVTGSVRRMDTAEGYLEFTDRSRIPLTQILALR